MSWWDLDDTNVLGDEPADRMRAALAAIASSSKPTLEEAFDSFAAALLPRVQDTKRITVQFESRQPYSSDGTVVHRNEDREEFARALDEIQQLYREQWGRNPRTQELLETFLFVVGYKPERFLRDAAGVEFAGIGVE
jgi:hypothetical protein